VVNRGKEPAPGFLIEWFQSKVDEAIAKHGTKRNPGKPTLPPDYDNPRKLPQAWLEGYLHRHPAQLAIDVIRAMDQNYQLKETVKWQKRALWIMGLVVSPLIGEVVKLVLHALLGVTR